MNRKERRAAARANGAPSTRPAVIADLMAEARRYYQRHNSAAAEALCKQILVAAPAHAAALNLLGVIYQAAGRHRQAIRMFAKAISADDRDAACHYNIASSYQILNLRADATIHFKRALLLGLSEKVVESMLMQNPELVGCVRQTMQRSDLPVRAGVLSAGDIALLADDILLRCAMQTCLLRGIELEFVLTHLRFALLQLAHREDTTSISDDVATLFSALAQQCFINEYVYAQSVSEAEQAGRLRERLAVKVAAGEAAPQLLLTAVAAYFPLAALPGAQSLVEAGGPRHVVDLMTQQISEPLEEAAHARAIPALTGVDDATSREVMQQYGENPYPRWTFDPPSVVLGAAAGRATTSAEAAAPDILIAGCGTGRHAFHVAQQWPEAHILAVDISRPSLAYARRKTREAALQNIEYAQADILNLGAIGRRFDRIEAIGVLHHLANPRDGWRVLLSLLKPDGVLRVGLYSELARQSIVAARRVIADAGHAATADGIRALRQSIIRDRQQPRWQFLLANAEDFYCVSGCRDLFFNVMEHRFTIPQLRALLAEEGLEFLGFELDDAAIEDFRRRHPAAEAPTNLGDWHAFEQARPHTFRHMYVFSARKYAATAC